jgi:translation initiation factor eIF-2B subunit delta
VVNILKRAHSSSNKSFRVIVVDKAPDISGRLALEELSSVGVTCAYAAVTAIQQAMHKVSKVLLGAEAIMTNGAVMAPIGTSQVALAACTVNVPVTVCCETFKFSETDSAD